MAGYVGKNVRDSLQYSLGEAEEYVARFKREQAAAGDVLAATTKKLRDHEAIVAELTAFLAANDETKKEFLIMNEKTNTQDTKPAVQFAGDVLQKVCHDASYSAGWWRDPVTGVDHRELVRDPSSRFGKALVAEKLMLTVSEVGEAMEGHRKGLMDDKLPHFPMMATELADTIIRAFDLAGALGYDMGAVIGQKLAYNAVRPDHKIENRVAAGGKAY